MNTYALIGFYILMINLPCQLYAYKSIANVG